MIKRVELTPHWGNPSGKVAWDAARAAEEPTRMADDFILDNVSGGGLTVPREFLVRIMWQENQ